MFDVMGGDRDKSDPTRLVDAIPPERFGKSKARILRKLVLLAIAKSANPDGSNAYPSRDTIAHRCLVSDRAVDSVIKWAVAEGLLGVQSKAKRISVRGRTILINLYEIIFPPEHHEKSSPRSEIELQGVEPHSEESSPHPEQSQPHPEQSSPTPRSSISHNRPSDRPNTDHKTGSGAEEIEATANEAKHETSSLSDLKSKSASDGEKQERQMAEEYEAWLEIHADDWPPATFKPSQSKLWADYLANQTARFKRYSSWLAEKYPTLTLIDKEKKAVKNCLLIRPWHDRNVVEAATRLIVDDLDPSDSYDHAGAKLAAGLAEKCDWIAADWARQKRQREELDRYSEMVRQQHEREWEAGKPERERQAREREQAQEQARKQRQEEAIARQAEREMEERERYAALTDAERAEEDARHARIFSDDIEYTAEEIAEATGDIPVGDIPADEGEDISLEPEERLTTALLKRKAVA